jgi:tripartite-type tricarboxylate transporter receptor subunit TctC
MRATAAALLLFLGGAVAAPASAQTFPDKPVRFVVPFPAGGGNEITARALAEGMTKDLGQQVIIEIKPGAGTIIGTEFAMKSPPDGYTILMASFAHNINQNLQAKLPYDHTKVAHVAMIGRYANVVVVNPDRPFKTMKELIEHARANPGKLNYGSFGNGSSPHFFVEMLKYMAKLDITHIPYKGASPAIIDLLGGRLDMVFSTSASAQSHIRSGKLRHLAVTSGARSSFFPDVPTVAESGVPGYDAVAFYGVLAPGGTPPALIQRLYQSIQTSARSELFQKRAKEDGVELDIGGPEKLAAFMKAEEERWKKVIIAAKMRPD